jgi:hypothetical protein
VALLTKLETIGQLTWEEVVGIREAVLGKPDEYEPIPASAVTFWAQGHGRDSWKSSARMHCLLNG